uniref:Uncharacterized protein n=1 Tax=Anguilla anguilla TaxID=7936 RepID=A0A0E9WM31_ANGAN
MKRNTFIQPISHQANVSKLANHN